MKLLNLSIILACITATSFANADLLTTKQADAICHSAAVSSAHFILKTDKKLYVSAKAADVYEISTPIAYEFRMTDNKDESPVATVQAFAYPSDQTCVIGSIVNNIAGND